MWLEITTEDIDVAAVRQFVSLPACGAQVVFAGQTRDHSSLLTDVTHLEYSAYESFILPIFRKMAEPLLESGDIQRVAIIHKLGRVELGETSVLIAVCSPHRAEAFAANQFLIDTLKKEAPIWKKEFSKSASSWGEICSH